MAANGTSHFIGRPGAWHSLLLSMDEGAGGRKLSIKGTGEVELRTPWGELKTGVLPISQVHRINAMLVANDFVSLQLPAAPPGAPNHCSIALTNAERQRVIHTVPPGYEVPPFDNVRNELLAVIDELFPKANKKPGLFQRLFGGRKSAQS